MQSKIDERRTEKNGGLHGVKPWRTVKSSLQGWSKHSSSVNPRVSVLSSPTIHPFTHLYLCSSDEDKRKHSLIRSLPPFFFSWSLQARLAVLISYCDLTAWWKDWHACTNTHGTKWAHVYACTHMWQREGQGPVLLGLITPWVRPRAEEGFGEGGVGVAYFNVSHCSQDTHIHLKNCVWLGAERLFCFQPTS